MRSINLYTGRALSYLYNLNSVFPPGILIYILFDYLQIPDAESSLLHLIHDTIDNSSIYVCMYTAETGQGLRYLPKDLK